MAKKKLPIPIESLRYVVMLDDGMGLKEIAAEVGKSRQAVAQSLDGLNKLVGVEMSRYDGAARKLSIHGELLARESRPAVAAYDAAIKVVEAMQLQVTGQEDDAQ